MFIDQYRWLTQEIPETGCLKWTGSLRGSHNKAMKDPRPCVRVGGRLEYVARLVCEEVNGPPPTLEHQAAHTVKAGCIGGLCVNGNHLVWATPSENRRDVF